MKKEGRKTKIFIGIVFVIILLLLLIKCGSGGKKEEEIVVREKNIEQLLLDEMKADEQELLDLYDRGDICSEKWVEEFLALANKFQQYEYEGNAEDIRGFLVEYKEYGMKLEEIAELMKKANFEESIKKLGELEEYAEEMEGRLNELYQKYHQES
jgi:hypothetical protein